MSTHATGSFTFKSWDEQPYSEVEGGAKLTHAAVANVFQGDIVGEGTLQYLMVYRDAGSGSFVGLEHLVGSVGGRAGSFVLQHSGTFEGTGVNTDWSVVPGSGTGDLRGLLGEGSFVARHGEQQTSYTLDYEFE